MNPLYSVGAVGYLILTGEPVFAAENIVDLCQQHVDEVPILPSRRLDNQISEELEHALMSCLEKSRSKRPQTARDLAELLKRCPEAKTWTRDEADAWWSRHNRGKTDAGQSSAETGTGGSEYDRTMDFGS